MDKDEMEICVDVEFSYRRDPPRGAKDIVDVKISFGEGDRRYFLSERLSPAAQRKIKETIWENRNDPLALETAINEWILAGARRALANPKEFIRRMAAREKEKTTLGERAKRKRTT
jgi:hypothetical protein